MDYFDIGSILDSNRNIEYQLRTKPRGYISQYVKLDSSLWKQIKHIIDPAYIILNKTLNVDMFSDIAQIIYRDWNLIERFALYNPLAKKIDLISGLGHILEINGIAEFALSEMGLRIKADIDHFNTSLNIKEYIMRSMYSEDNNDLLVRSCINKDRKGLYYLAQNPMFKYDDIMDIDMADDIREYITKCYFGNSNIDERFIEKYRGIGDLYLLASNDKLRGDLLSKYINILPTVALRYNKYRSYELITKDYLNNSYDISNLDSKHIDKIHNPCIPFKFLI